MRHVVDCRTGGKAKTLKVAKDALSSGKSVVVDNTHRSVTVTLQLKEQSQVPY
jgi:hypothetical protein